LAEEAGQATGASDVDWREVAARPDASAAQRVLLELIWYLEEKGYAVTKPLTKEHLEIFHKARELDATMGALIAGATERILDDRVAGSWLKKPKRVSAGDGQYQRFTPRSRSWVSRYAGKLYLGFDEEPCADGSRRNQLTASVTVELPRRQGELLREREAFMDQLRDRAVQFAVDDYAGYCWSSLPGSELAALNTIGEQTERLAGWAKEAFAVLLALKPGPNRLR